MGPTLTQKLVDEHNERQKGLAEKEKQRMSVKSSTEQSSKRNKTSERNIPSQLKPRS